MQHVAAVLGSHPHAKAVRLPLVAVVGLIRALHSAWSLRSIRLTIIPEWNVLHNAVMKVDVAIVGGGVIGWSGAYHILSQRPDASVVVVDRNPTFAMGSTGRAAGGVRAQFGTAINILLSLYSISAFERFEQEIGVDISFRQYGYLLVSSNETTQDYMEAAARLQTELGVDVALMGRDQVAEIAPYIRSDDLLGGSFSPRDGYLDPHAVCAGYHHAARRLGAQAWNSVEVIGGHTTYIETSKGALRAGRVVLAPGHWSRDVARSFGIELGVVPVKHQLALTSAAPALPEALPMVVDLSTTFHFRREGAGLLLGYDDPLAGPSDRSEGFDFRFLDHIAEPGMHRLPALAELAIDPKKCWAGFYAETPDHHAIIGTENGVILCTGFGGHGVMHSPAAGRAIAELALDGECRTFDLHPLRPQRFTEGELVTEAFVI